MAADFSTRSEQHEREKTFPHENIDALKKSGAYKMRTNFAKEEHDGS